LVIISKAANSSKPSSGTRYNITDYYTQDGKLSGLGQALGTTNDTAVLRVAAGDILTLGNLRYEVKKPSLTLPFYTQPSLDLVVRWWTAWLHSQAEADAIRAVT